MRRLRFALVSLLRGDPADPQLNGVEGLYQTRFEHELASHHGFVRRLSLRLVAG
jgi:hypothetical protein